jgi:hypothetical protein
MERFVELGDVLAEAAAKAQLTVSEFAPSPE